jgi:hypothetical protein
MGLIKDYISFLKKEKKWWLIPLIILLIAVGSIIIFFEGSSIAPFIYALF